MFGNGGTLINAYIRMIASFTNRAEMAVLVSVQHLIEELAHCSFRFKYGITMVHRSG
jgi:hypothetical protein